MSLTLKLVLIVVFAFIIGRFLERFTRRFASLSAAEYMVVGFAIGPGLPQILDALGNPLGLSMTPVLTREALKQLQPFFSLLFGLFGFVMGMQANRALRQPGLGSASFFSSFTVLVGFTLLILPALDWVYPQVAVGSDFELDHELFRVGDRVLAIQVASNTLWLALGLAACATVSSTDAIQTMRGDKSGRVADFLQATARAGQLTGIVVVGLVLAATRATSEANRFSMTVVEWSVAAGLLGIICGILFALFLGRESEPSRIFLAAVGLVIFASGTGAALGISPLFVNLVAGVVVANTSTDAERVREQLQRLNHPLLVLVLVFGGALWAPVQGWVWLLVPTYVLIRWGLRRLGARIASRSVLEPPLITRHVGNGLLSHGTLAVAIALNLGQRFPAWSAVVVNTVLVGVLISDLFSRQALKRVLLAAGELEEVSKK